MFITYDQFMGYPETKRFRIIGGQKGTDRLIRGIVSIDIPDPWNFINEGDIVMTTGISDKNPETDIEKMIRNLDKNGGSGLAIAVGKYINDIPKGAIELADNLKFPLMVLPYSLKNSTIQNRVYRELFQMEQNVSSRERLMYDLVCNMYDPSFRDRIIQYGYNNHVKHTVLSINVWNMEKYCASHPECTETRLKQRIDDAFQREFNLKRKNYISTIQFNDVVALIEVRDILSWETLLLRSLNQVIREIREEADGLELTVGIGNPITDLKQFRSCTMEARKAARNLKSCGRYYEARLYKNMGVYQLFYSVDTRQLVQIFKEILGPLLNEGNAVLVDTLENYLDCDMVIADTAEKMFLHRNTIKNRIQQIEPLLNGDLHDVNYCFNLRLAFKIKKYLFSRSDDVARDYSNLMAFIDMGNEEVN